MWNKELAFGRFKKNKLLWQTQSFEKFYDGSFCHLGVEIIITFLFIIFNPSKFSVFEV